MLDGLLMPEHGGHANSLTLLFWGSFWPLVGLILLVGSILLVIYTNAGFRRAMTIVAGSFFGYLFIQSITWVLSGNGPRIAGNAGYWADRIRGIGIGLGALLIFAAIMVSSHISERRAQAGEAP